MKMYEDALIYANIALSIDPDHQSTNFRKATALAFMFNFDKCRETMKLLNVQG